MRKILNLSTHVYKKSVLTLKKSIFPFFMSKNATIYGWNHDSKIGAFARVPGTNPF